MGLAKPNPGVGGATAAPHGAGNAVGADQANKLARLILGDAGLPGNGLRQCFIPGHTLTAVLVIAHGESCQCCAFQDTN